MDFVPQKTRRIPPPRYTIRSPTPPPRGSVIGQFGYEGGRRGDGYMPSPRRPSLDPSSSLAKDSETSSTPSGNTRFGRGVHWADQQHYLKESGLPGYHYERDDSGRLLNVDTHPDKTAIKRRANIFLFIAMVLDILLLAWPITAIVIWGIVESILTLVFAVHIAKAFLLFIELFRFNSPIHKMFGRKEYGSISGVWTRVTHVKSSTPLFLYGILYGWVQIPLMCFYVILSLISYPLMTTTFFWISWPMGIVSIVVGYFAWCFIVSEMAIRKQLEPYIFGDRTTGHFNV